MLGMKAFAFFAFVFAVGTILCGIMEGTGGISVTGLSADVNDAAVIIDVNDTAGFPTAAYPESQRHIVIGKEVIGYTATTATSFTGCTRGDTHPRTLESTDAAAHEEDVRVMNASASAINNLMGELEASSTSVFGTLTTLVFSTAFWGALWQALMWDYSFFTGQLAIVRIVLVVTLSGGFLFGLVMAAVSLAQGLFRP